MTLFDNKPLERDIQPDIIEDARLLGWDAHKVHREAQNGYPDIQCTRKVGDLLEGVLIETKRHDGRAGVQQLKRHKELRAAGWKVYICTDPRAARDLLRR